MELKKQSAKFTANRDVTIVSELGNMCAVFEAGQTLEIPKALFNAALTAGLIPEGKLEKEPEPEPNQTQEVRTKTGLQEACKVLIAQGNPADFVMSGYPRAASVKKLVDFDFTAADMRVAFEEAMHEVNQNDDDSKEPAESSGVAS